MKIRTMFPYSKNFKENEKFIKFVKVEEVKKTIYHNIFEISSFFFTLHVRLSELALMIRLIFGVYKKIRGKYTLFSLERLDNSSFFMKTQFAESKERQDI